MDEHNRMMHPTSAMLPQPYGMSSVDPNHGAPTPPDQDTRKQDIGEILQQIMNITDQSLDEAQARYVQFPILLLLFIYNFSFCHTTLAI